MKKILILSTGGTFNKIYDPLTGKLTIDSEAQAIHHILKLWQADYAIETLIDKDSLDMDAQDRHALLVAVRQAEAEAVVILHGTDTMDQSAAMLAQAQLHKHIVLTGAMVPWSIDPVEATANLASAIGYLQAGQLSHGVYIAMNGQFGPHDHVIKDRQIGKFVAVA